MAYALKLKHPTLTLAHPGAKPGPIRGGRGGRVIEVTDIPDDIGKARVIAKLGECLLVGDVVTIPYALLRRGRVIREGDDADLVDQVRLRMAELGVSQIELAGRLDVHEVTVRRWLARDREIPIERVAAALGLRVRLVDSD